MENKQEELFESSGVVGEVCAKEMNSIVATIFQLYQICQQFSLKTQTMQNFHNKK